MRLSLPMPILAAACSALLLACPGAASVQCAEDANCNRFAGGLCRVAASGSQWCSYPDPACPSGYRYSDLDVGDGLEARCVTDTAAGEPDAGAPATDALPRCGDRIVTPPEGCDDGNTAPGDGCSESCQLECGNGVIDPGEICDDGNTSCGTCSADCRSEAAARASGTILVVAGSDITTGDSFTLSDGITGSRTFEFTRNGTGAPGNKLISVSSITNVDAVCERVKAAIDTSGLRVIAALFGSETVIVSNAYFTSAGNVPITESVAHPRFEVIGMSGGAGGDCRGGQRCQSNLDCRTNVCSMNVCQ